MSLSWRHGGRSGKGTKPKPRPEARKDRRARSTEGRWRSIRPPAASTVRSSRGSRPRQHAEHGEARRGPALQAAGVDLRRRFRRRFRRFRRGLGDGRRRGCCCSREERLSEGGGVDGVGIGVVVGQRPRRRRGAGARRGDEADEHEEEAGEEGRQASRAEGVELVEEGAAEGDLHHRTAAQEERQVLQRVPVASRCHLADHQRHVQDEDQASQGSHQRERSRSLGLWVHELVGEHHIEALG
mmetsp:Transcript_102499/g.265479  ORF Transcript_102499/g.265479 Transcript_102499/m.265479 type:complete len:241 (+) Transcript_102499:142-864(+)